MLFGLFPNAGLFLPNLNMNYIVGHDMFGHFYNKDNYLYVNKHKNIHVFFKLDK